MVGWNLSPAMSQENLSPLSTVNFSVEAGAIDLT